MLLEEAGTNQKTEYLAREKEVQVAMIIKRVGT